MNCQGYTRLSFQTWIPSCKFIHLLLSCIKSSVSFPFLTSKHVSSPNTISIILPSILFIHLYGAYFPTHPPTVLTLSSFIICHSVTSYFTSISLYCICLTDCTIRCILNWMFFSPPCVTLISHSHLGYIQDTHTVKSCWQFKPLGIKGRTQLCILNGTTSYKSLNITCQLQ